MIDDLERGRSLESDDRQVGSWRSVFSAWALVLLCILLLAGAQAMACRRDGSHAQAHLAGAVIPRHDTSCGGPGIPSAHGVDRCENLPISEDRSAYW
jgi:hypothetical protein